MITKIKSMLNAIEKERKELGTDDMCSNELIDKDLKRELVRLTEIYRTVKFMVKQSKLRYMFDSNKAEVN